MSKKDFIQMGNKIGLKVLTEGVVTNLQLNQQTADHQKKMLSYFFVYLESENYNFDR
jgi:hypothetical protein